VSGSRYNITKQNSIYFITITVVDWVDIFTRKDYKIIISDSLNRLSTQLPPDSYRDWITDCGNGGATQNTEGYRFGFNSQEKDNEVYGEGNANTAQFWEYDTRLGRRWNMDPVDKPWIAPYHAFSNNPILFCDPNGSNEGDFWRKSKDGKSLEFAGTDNKPDNKNYILHDNSSFTGMVTPENADDVLNKGQVSLYPDQNVREFIGNQVKDLVKETRLIEGDHYTGTFYEIGGFAGTNSDGSIPVGSKAGDPHIPNSLKESYKLEVDPLTPADGVTTAGTLMDKGYDINFIWHTHGSAIKSVTGSEQGSTFGGSYKQNVFDQNPSEPDFANIASYEQIYFQYRGGSAIQVSVAGKGQVNFYNGGGTTVSLPLSVFTTPLPKQ